MIRSTKVSEKFVLIECTASDAILTNTAISAFGSTEAAEDLRKDRSVFASNVRRSLAGGAISKLFSMVLFGPKRHCADSHVDSP